jgi:predicted DNA binding CopG/RHH family protein
MQDVNIKISNEDLQRIKKKLEIINPVSNKNLVRFAITEYLKRQVIQ